LVDLGDLRLEDGDGISDRRLLGSSSNLGSSEAHSGEGSELGLGGKLGKHSLIIIIIISMVYFRGFGVLGS
jgi:hypothetical protein